jgi:lysozyme family protein
MAAVDYLQCEDRVLAHEGSRYTDGVHPYDPGGPTRWGITITDARLYWKPDATADDVKIMPRSVAVDIYRKRYWATVRGDDLPPGVDDTVFDYGVNSGIGRSGKVLRAVLGLPTNTSKVTDEVIAALRQRDHEAVIRAVNAERLKFLQSLAIWPTYRAGWTIRVREVLEFSLLLAGGAIPPKSPTQIPSDGMGKGTVPPPTTTKQINVGAGVTITAALAAAANWIGAHPAVTIVVVGGAIAAVAVIHSELTRRHVAQSETPMPGTEVVPAATTQPPP